MGKEYKNLQHLNLIIPHNIDEQTLTIQDVCG